MTSLFFTSPNCWVINGNLFRATYREICWVCDRNIIMSVIKYTCYNINKRHASTSLTFFFCGCEFGRPIVTYEQGVSTNSPKGYKPEYFNKKGRYRKHKITEIFNTLNIQDLIRPLKRGKEAKKTWWKPLNYVEFRIIACMGIPPLNNCLIFRFQLPL